MIDHANLWGRTSDGVADGHNHRTAAGSAPAVLRKIVEDDVYRPPAHLPARWIHRRASR
jgi:hypothetical protein